jgi:hypothetical protein
MSFEVVGRVTRVAVLCRSCFSREPVSRAGQQLLVIAVGVAVVVAVLALMKWWL